ncbi:flagellar FlbD family protein [Butyrivibrio sp. AE2032]|uniref:flagellar FlbD family protein n=1 Tax=Butyrivibrio sp. AE2032 TaxID=1458463 RepID=UPI000556A2D7|nr:flagellar FlbD family protein [Butyrivibrio sp. AE2032]
MGSIIELTKLDTRKIYINADLIETVEANPDTVIILMSGRKLLVKEKPEEIYKIINSQKVE